ncbi:MAG: hypothetical protein KIT22_04640 [Verrucomicrobiae bacterium]|nr:hypothetical protein [Verrucomicrobiae bacterium]
MTASARIWFVGAPLFCALIPLVCISAVERMAVAPHGSEAFLWLELLFVLPAMVAVPAFIVALVGLAFQRVRRYAIVLALCSLAYWVAFIFSLRLGESVRMRAFHRLAERSKPLVAAVHAYEQKHGRPPESLEALVPEFIPFVPSTGMGAYPEYRYSTPATNHDGNPWVITVFTPSGGINFDQFMYFPLTNYPKAGYGGWLERIGDWAYVHE